MNTISTWIIRFRKLLLVFFILASIAGLLLSTQVKVNYNLQDYVPEDAESTKALHVMKEEFDQAIPNVRLYVPDVTPVEALAVKEEILRIPQVSGVMWLDDFLDLKEPLEMQDPKVVEGFYDGGALYQVTTDLDDAPQTMHRLQEIAGEGGAVEGQLIDLAMAQMAVNSEILMIMGFMIPLGLLILTLSTRSWMEPLILLATIGVAIFINMGTNILLDEVSFITQAVAAVLQLAVSMDYAIFLLHAREEYLAQGFDRLESMRLAIIKSSNAILASSMTTVLGFLALIFMSYRIGSDMGIVLAKGVVFSLVSVIFFMPTLMLAIDETLQKTMHRSFLPSFKGLGAFIAKYAVWLLIIGLLFPVAFLAQNKNDFMYGMSDYGAGSKESADREFIMDRFGRYLSMALMVPQGDWGREHELHEELRSMDEVIAITSYQTEVGRLIPSGILPKDQLSMLLSDNYSRIILTVNSEKEGDQAFELVDTIRDTARKYYGDAYHLIGESVVMRDMKTSINRDNVIVNGLAIASVWLVLLISFRSLSIPFLLILTIEGSIWINLAIPYVTGTRLAYIGYLIISTVQLGATVDYAILFTQHYLSNRIDNEKRKAIELTVNQTFATLITPAMILSLAGVILSVVSSLEVVSQLGTVLGRGAFLSFLMVNFFLPGLLYISDSLIEKTTWKVKFLRRSP